MSTIVIIILMMFRDMKFLILPILVDRVYNYVQRKL